MSQESKTTVDLIRWTFAIEPGRRNEIEAHLHDLGADVMVRGGDQFVVNWEEPDENLDAVVEALWDLNGGAFEVTVEEFHRVGLHTLESDDASAQQAA